MNHTVTAHPTSDPLQSEGMQGAGKLGVLAALALIPLAMRSERHYLNLPQLSKTAPAGDLPVLSIVVPARNEAANLPYLLDSLCALRYPGRLEIIVVDDRSEDDTAAIARRYGAKLLQTTDPPPGWTGKSHACHQGAQTASGQWLLFVDADTRHEPDGAARAVAHALAHNLHGLSLFLPNVSSGAADRLALMAAYASFFAASGPTAGVLNGQFILLRRDIYETSGGFAAVRDQVTEDLALGRRLQAQGYRVPIMRGDGVGTVHMYRDVRHLWQGLARYAVASLRWTRIDGLWAMLLTILLAAPAELFLWALLRGRRRRGAGLRGAFLSWSTATWAMLGWAGRFGGRRWALLAPLGALQVQFAAIYGIARRLFRRGVPWKGRVL